MYACSQCEMLMTICVGAGSVPPKSLNIFSKTGMTFVSMTTTTSVAITVTAAG